MKRFALTLALLLTAGSAAANDFGAIFYVVQPRETVVYNQAANCVDEVGTTLKAAPVVPSIALVCQTQQWTQPSPGGHTFKVKDTGNLDVALNSFNFVSGQYVTHTTYRNCRETTPHNQTGFFVRRFVCKDYK